MALSGASRYMRPGSCGTATKPFNLSKGVRKNCPQRQHADEDSITGWDDLDQIGVDQRLIEFDGTSNK